MIKWNNFQASSSSNGSLAAKLSESHKTIVEKNRGYLCKVVYVVRLLAKLGLPFLEHKEGEESESRGNFLKVCSFFIEI